MKKSKMKKEMMENTILDDAQLENVNGGVSPGTVIAALGIFAKLADGTAKDLRSLVNSFEYKNMSDEEKGKAVGKLLANSVAFNSAYRIAHSPFNPILGAAHVVAMQVDFRKNGVSADVRKFIENNF